MLDTIDTTLPEEYQLTRLGKPSPNYCRAIKLIVSNKANRDKILSNANKLKDVQDPWKNIYLKRDLHPVIVQENTRLRKKKKELQKIEGNGEVKIEKGKLRVNGVVVDQNLFF